MNKVTSHSNIDVYMSAGTTPFWQQSSSFGLNVNPPRHLIMIGREMQAEPQVWSESLGFIIHDTIKVQFSKGCLVLLFINVFKAVNIIILLTYFICKTQNFPSIQLYLNIVCYNQDLVQVKYVAPGFYDIFVYLHVCL